jgi:hypothetical protein
MKFSSLLYKIRKIVSDVETILGGSLSKIVKRFLIRKPLYKKFNEWMRKI